MTATQMKYEFEVGYDRVTNFAAPGYTEKEISTFLTKAQEQVVLELYKDKNHYKEDFKKSLNMLKSSTTISSFTTGVYPSSYVGNLSSDVMFVYNELATITTNTSHTYPSTVFQNIQVKPVDDDFYHLNRSNPFKKPSIDRVWRLDYHTDANKQHVYVVDTNASLTSVKVLYYKKPNPIIVQWANYSADDGAIDGVNWITYQATDLDCALDPIIHREIVDRAVQLAFAAFQDEKGFGISAAQEQMKPE